MDQNQPKTVRTKSLSERVEDYLLANYKVMIGVFVAFVISIGAYAGYQTISSKREKSAQDELFVITSEIEKKVTELNDKAQAENKDKSPKKVDLMDTLKEVEKTPETLARDLGPQVQKLESFLKDHTDKKAAFIGAMTLSDIYLDYQEPKKAADVLKSISEKPSKDDLFYGLLNSQYALALSNSGQCGEAVDVYDRILGAKEQKHIHAQAMVRKGVCLMTLNKLDQAKDVFQEARTEYPDSVSGRSAESFERYIALKKGQVQ